MKIVSWIKPLLVLIILIYFYNDAYSQVVVERSKDKVVISGTPYYVHLVKKGETAYSISKAYGITVGELIKENPPAVYGVNEGQSLRIPLKSVPVINASEPIPLKRERDESKFLYHNLKPGETVYFLSKSYGVSENEIILSNPGIDINKLPVGSEIAIPRRVFMSDKLKFDNQEKKYIYHKVLPGESLSSIAEHYGLTVRELRRANRNIRFPQVGDFIRIPGVSAAEPEETEHVETDTVPPVMEEGERLWERPVGFTEVGNLSDTLNVAVLLPFYLERNSVRSDIDSSRYIKGRKQYRIINKPEDWIYPESLDFIEMYLGILLAADTLRSMGLDINLFFFDIRIDTVEITRLIRSGKLSGMDLIIGPVYSHNLLITAAYAKEMGIPVVSPVPLFNNSALLNNPTLFMANSSLEIAQKILSNKISEYSDHNIVFIHTDTTGVNPDVTNFKNMIFTELSYKLPYDQIRFKELIFYSRSMFDNDSINRLSHALSEKSKNLVIIASEEAPVISETMMEVHGLSKKYNIKLFGYPVMKDITTLPPEYFFDMEILLYYPYWIDYEKDDIKQFNKDFRQKFLTEPNENSYAWQGYDITYYFLSGLALHKKDFISHPEIHYPDLLQTEYDFIRKEPGSGFENHKLFLLRYTKNYEVKLVDNEPDLQPDLQLK